MSGRITRSSIRQQQEAEREHQRRLDDERHWQDVNENGFELALSHNELDEQGEQLSRYTVSSDNWRLFFNDYFQWIVSDIRESLRVARRPTYEELEEMPFWEGGFDNTFYPRTNDVGQQQQLINFASDLYDRFFHQMQNVSLETSRLCPIVTESLYHIFRNLQNYVDTGDLETSKAHYSESMVIVDLLLDERLFYLYMTGTPTGNRRRVKSSHPDYYIGIWARKAPIWGLGHNQEHNFGQLKAFIRNYSRRMIDYMYNYNSNYNMVNMGSVFYRGRLRGGADNIEKIKISNIEKNKYNTKYKMLFIEKSVKNAYGRIESMLLDIVMDMNLKSRKLKKKSSRKKASKSKKETGNVRSKTKTKSTSKSPSKTISKSKS
jgi:hypothetical protein